MWCDERLLVDVIGPKGVVSTSLMQPFARVGTHTDSEVVLADGPLNGRSLYLHATAAGVFCLDLRRVQGDSANLGFWLKPTDEVGIGRYWLRASLQGPMPQETPQFRLDEAESATYPRPVLSILSGKRSVAKKRLQSSLNTVGRWPQCGLHLQGQLVSGVHCALYWNDGRLWCIDLLSSNRTLHRAEPITCIELKIGERIEVGEFEILFERLSRQKPPKQKSRRSQTRTTSELNRKSGAAKSLRSTWRESEPSVSDNSGFDLSATISPHRSDSQASDITASDSAISVEPPTAVNRATLPDSGSHISDLPITSLLPELQELEDLRQRLEGKFSQIQAEANQLAELTQKLNSVSQQWAENRAEVIGLLTASLSPTALSNISQPPTPTSSLTITNHESCEPKFEPKLLAPPAALKSGTTAVADARSPADLIAIGTASAVPLITEAGSPLPRLTAAVALHDQVAAVEVETAKATGSTPSASAANASRPLPSGRGTRRASIQRNELVDFVSDRIALIERQRQRKKLFIGLGVATAILVLIGIVGGLWYRFAPSDVSLNRPHADFPPTANP